ncbi:MAG: ATP-binding cassette domain-containing protein [Planctomycetaceae bacterium]
MTAVVVENIGFRYGDRRALAGVSFDVRPSEIFGLLGPNGGGKTTLFRLLCTLLPFQEGKAAIVGCDVAREPSAVRNSIGVTFQAPSLDGKLTVGENLKAQGQLYGLFGSELQQRIGRLSDRLGIADRMRDRAETLSGGLKRRVEIAKGLLHDPQVLLLDEPSTGLDPGARHDLWRLLAELREGGMTVLVTTHLMEEADRCDRLAILNRGEIVALGTPDQLRESIGGDCLTIRGSHPNALAERIGRTFDVPVRVVAGSVRIEQQHGHELLRRVVETFPGEIASVTLGKPTLEDVFIARTGHRFWDEEQR